MLEGPRPCTILCFNVDTTVEYLNVDLNRIKREADTSHGISAICIT